MENNPTFEKKEVAQKNEELLEEHFNISVAQHNADIVSLFASDPEAVSAARKLVDNIQEVQDSHLEEARAFAAENLPALRSLAEEEDQLRQAVIEAKRLEEERNREELKGILSNVLRRPFNRASAIGNRESIIGAYCAENGITREELTGRDMMIISDMPEWIAEHPEGKGGFGHSTAAGITTLKF